MIKRLFILLLFCFICTPVWSAGCDSNTSALWHFNEADSTTDPSDENCDGSGVKQVTSVVGDFQTDSGITKYSNTLLCDGNDKGSTADSSAWELVKTTTGTQSFEFWVNFTAADPSTTGQQTILAQRSDANNEWEMQHIGTSGGYRFVVFVGGAAVINTGFSGAITDSNWHHFLWIRKGSEYGMYTDGDIFDYLSDTSTADFNQNLDICDVGGAGAGFAGNLDELRFYEGNYFELSPDSGLTDSFTVPTEEYSVASTRERWFNFSKGFKYQQWKRYVKRQDSGYDREIERHWYTHKDAEVGDKRWLN